MPAKAVLTQVTWQPVEGASFGLIYGAIMLVALSCGLSAEPEYPFEATMLNVPDGAAFAGGVGIGQVAIKYAID